MPVSERKPARLRRVRVDDGCQRAEAHAGLHGHRDLRDQVARVRRHNGGAQDDVLPFLRVDLDKPWPASRTTSFANRHRDRAIALAFFKVRAARAGKMLGRKNVYQHNRTVSGALEYGSVHLLQVAHVGVVWNACCLQE